MSSLNLFATIFTFPAPSSNYRGESEENRTVLQKIRKNGTEYPVISPESMRNALREILATWQLPCNRKRLHNKEQLAVEFKEFPNAEKYADDFLFGYMVADKDAIKKNKGKPAKRDSILRMNMAVAVTPYRYDALLNQSPLNAGESPWKNSGSSALLHREVSHTAFQYPFALHIDDCKVGKGALWAATLVKAISQLSNVAGGHARSLFDMAPKSVVARLTTQLVAGYNTYGFDENGDFTELSRLRANDLPANEFWLGGDVVRRMPETTRKQLMEGGAQMDENPQKLLERLAKQAFGVAP